MTAFGRVPRPCKAPWKTIAGAVFDLYSRLSNKRVIVGTI